MISSNNQSHDFLAPGRLKKILESLANLPDEIGAKKALHFKRHYWSFFEPEIPWAKVSEWASRLEEEDFVDLSEDEILWTYWLIPVRDAVRIVWVSSDLRRRQCAIFRILQKYLVLGDPSVCPGPLLEDSESFLRGLGSPSGCEIALMQLASSRGLTKICANPECDVPYFWAAKKSQKYCSEICALPTVRLSKRMWWEAHGSEWRRTRKKTRHRRRNVRRMASGQWTSATLAKARGMKRAKD